MAAITLHLCELAKTYYQMFYKAWRKMGPTLKSLLIPHLTHFVTWRFRAIIKNESHQAKNLDDDLTRKYSSVTNQSQSKEVIQVIGIIYPAFFWSQRPPNQNGFSAFVKVSQPTISGTASPMPAGRCFNTSFSVFGIGSFIRKARAL
jgi:hypothetical protein